MANKRKKKVNKLNQVKFSRYVCKWNKSFFPWLAALFELSIARAGYNLNTPVY